MKNYIARLSITLVITGITFHSFSQSVGIGTQTPDTSAALDITHAGKGLLIPRMTSAAINAIEKPARGLMILDTLLNQLMVNMGTVDDPVWQSVAAKTSWSLSGNYNTNPVTQFVGTNDTRPLRFGVNGVKAGELNPVNGNTYYGFQAALLSNLCYSNVAIGSSALKANSYKSNLVAIGDSALLKNGIGAVSPDDASANTAIGSKAMMSNTIGSRNTAVGHESLYSNSTGSVNTAFGGKALYSNTTGRFNSATGFASMQNNTSGESNTANGYSSLFSNTTGHDNTSMGFQSMLNNSTGAGNTAIGSQALLDNSTGGDNTAIGSGSLRTNSTGVNNTAAGALALNQNSDGSNNVATGVLSLYSNTTGSYNTSNGVGSLYWNSTGNANTSNGFNALYSNNTGQANTAVGNAAMRDNVNGSFNTAIGYSAAQSHNLGFNNTIIGANAGVTIDGLYNCVALGESAQCTANNQVRVGNSVTTSIGGTVGFSTLSDGRFKKNVQERVKGLDFIMKLRPVTYQLEINELNNRLNVSGESVENSKASISEKEKMIYSGFIAQEVEQAANETGFEFSGIDKPKNSSDLYSLRYAEFVVPIIKAMQEQQVMIEELKKENMELRKLINDRVKK